MGGEKSCPPGGHLFHRQGQAVNRLNVINLHPFANHSNLMGTLYAVVCRLLGVCLST